MKLYEALAALGSDDKITRPGGPVVRKSKGPNESLHVFVTDDGQRFEPSTTQCIVADWDFIAADKPKAAPAPEAKAEAKRNPG
jgi:hypothetical protein